MTSTSNSTSNSSPPPSLYTASEVAHLLRVSPRTIRRWRQMGILNSVDVVGTNVFRFVAADIRALLARHANR